MKVVKQGRCLDNFWPWNKDLTCYKCGGVYRLERNHDERFIKTEEYEAGTQWDPYTATHRFVEFACPNCKGLVREVEHNGNI